MLIQLHAQLEIPVKARFFQCAPILPVQEHNDHVNSAVEPDGGAMENDGGDNS